MGLQWDGILKFVVELVFGLNIVEGSLAVRGLCLLFALLTSVSVCRESFRTFRELSEIFSDDNNYSLSRELLVKVGDSFSTANTDVSKPGLL